MNNWDTPEGIRETIHYQQDRLAYMRSIKDEIDPEAYNRVRRLTLGFLSAERDFLRIIEKGGGTTRPLQEYHANPQGGDTVDEV